MWGAMNAQGLTELHVLPQKQIVNTTYYIHEIRKKSTSIAQLSLQRGLRSAEENGTRHVFMQDGAPAHTSKETQ